MSLPAPFAALAAYRRFVTYAMEPDADRPGKTIKRPTDVRTGLYCNSNLAEHQYSYDEAAATGRHVGFVFDRADGFFFLDLDECLDGDKWDGQAQELCAKFAGAAVEVSQSGRGLHIIGRGNCPPHASKNIPAKLELYTHARFCALTCQQAGGDAGSDHTAALARLVERYFPHNPHGEIAGWTDTPCEEYGGPTDDEQLLRAAMASGRKSVAAAFGTGNVTFADLWLADADKLAAKWPDGQGGYDASQADASLASHLAFWTGRNHERTRALMLRSGLARQKWEDRPEWLETTILKAASVVKAVAQERETAPPPDIAPATLDALKLLTIALRAGTNGYMSAQEQIAYFVSCVYVVDLHKVWVPGTGELLDKARFDVVYGGKAFAIDSANEKMTDSAFDAFTKNRHYEAPRVDKICFRPEHTPGEIIQEDGRRVVNVYIPILTKRIAGDPSKFLSHIFKLLPNGRDAAILLHYMACVVQNPGWKGQWWPLIQGAEGNGKSLLERQMSYSVGSRYSHLVNPEAMAKTGNQFNKWVLGTLWVGFEEIYVANRREFLESFKATVTNDRVPIEGKGMDQTTGDNRANGMLLSNHPEAVPISIDSRRYCIFFTAQQSAADIERDGMGDNYFVDLYDWLNGRGAYAEHGPNYGFAIVNEYLHNFKLSPELDPRLVTRAPKTSSTDLALSYGLGKAEQEILEAIAESRPGFAAGFVSSLAVDKLLDFIRAPVPRTKRRGLLQALGYDWHPGLPDGRVTTIVAPDHGKPRLFVCAGHATLDLTDPLAIAKAYSAAQETAANAAGAAARFGTK